MTTVLAIGNNVTIDVTRQQAKALLALLDNSVVSDKGIDRNVYLGLIAMKDQLLHDVADAIGIDENDAHVMGSVYRQVEAMFVPSGVTEVAV